MSGDQQTLNTPASSPKQQVMFLFFFVKPLLCQDEHPLGYGIYKTVLHVWIHSIEFIYICSLCYMIIVFRVV